MKKSILIILITALVLIVLGVGFYFYQNLTNQKIDDVKYSEVNKEEALGIGFAKKSFAKYDLQKTKFTPSVPNYNLVISDISNLKNFEQSMGLSFSLEQKSTLLKNNFFIAQNNDKFYSDNLDDYSSRSDDWTYLYKEIGGPWATWEREPENSVFISSDYLLHVYHGLIDKEFEYIEQNVFYNRIYQVSDSLLKSSAKSYLTENNKEQKESFERLSAYFLVSSSILENSYGDYEKFKQDKFVEDSKLDTKDLVLQTAQKLAKENNISQNALKKAKEEITLIFESKNITLSPLFGKFQQEQGLEIPEDYTQYTPRSHYSKNTVLRNYFRTMMWFGRTNFLLSSPELTQDAGNISFMISNDSFKNWESVYLATSFFVGQSDDLGLYEFAEASKKLGLKQTDDFASKFQEELKNYKNPQIMSSAVTGNKVFDLTKEELQNKTKGFRLMGQRFTPDAFIFSNLTQGDEKKDSETNQALPSTPTALMVSTLMGSKVSGDLLNDWIKKQAPESDKIIAKKMADLEKYFSEVTEAQWTQNIYWSWLYTIKSVFTDNIDKKGYPMFVKNLDWDKKNLQTFLGSWTELKHDTLLYAKQSYAELGAAGESYPPKAVPKGYVEPNIEFLDRLIALAKLSQNGLSEYGLLPDEFFYKNVKLIESFEFYRKIALLEIENKKISDEDFEKLRLDANSLSQVLDPVGSERKTEKRARSAIIADVHTDAVEGNILYQADGIPNYIFVAVKDINGVRLTKGLVYSYFEFTNPIGKRLTDQDWQDWVYSQKSKIPVMQDWNKSLIK